MLSLFTSGAIVQTLSPVSRLINFTPCVLRPAARKLTIYL